eukprot:1161837-Pelagomonas_calceolata.AAC.3
MSLMLELRQTQSQLGTYWHTASDQEILAVANEFHAQAAIPIASTLRMKGRTPVQIPFWVDKAAVMQLVTWRRKHRVVQGWTNRDMLGKVSFRERRAAHDTVVWHDTKRGAAGTLQ